MQMYHKWAFDPKEDQALEPIFPPDLSSVLCGLSFYCPCLQIEGLSSKMDQKVSSKAGYKLVVFLLFLQPANSP